MRILIIAIALLAGVSTAFAQAERHEQDGSEGGGGNILVGPDIVVAAAGGELAAVRAELSRGTSPNTRNVHGITGLMAAVRYGHLAVVRLFIRNSARLDAADPQRNTALHYAARYNQFQAA